VLLVIDPIMAFLDETICTANDQSVRQALSPLAALAESTGCAIVLVRHLNKAGGARAVYRGGGSIGIIGACRSAWLIARYPGDEHRRVLAQIKNNLAAPQPSLGYEVVSDDAGHPRPEWHGPVELSADEILASGTSGLELSERERVAGLLREALASGPRPVAELEKELARQGVSRATLHRARKEAGVVSQLQRTATGAFAVWSLPAPAEPKPGEAARQLTLKLLDNYSKTYLDGR
jgi:hypothetical protein